ncbi:hypothetical protein E2542_SST02327 [Spatholobus suberectus]|nr:hypothetical protein E2542_SST02327 [Spatholobus suberectus]
MRKRLKAAWNFWTEYWGELIPIVISCKSTSNAASDTKPTVIFDKSTSKYMVSYDGLTIETTITDKASMVEEWIKFVSSTYTGNPRVVGLDTEWTRGQNKKMKVAILQLCIDGQVPNHSIVPHEQYSPVPKELFDGLRLRICWGCGDERY